ncbi:MAG: hypothetical protein WHS77_00380 [Brevinematales bacterium]
MDIFFLRSFWGLFYLTFLTGFVLIRILKYESSILRELLVSFGLSLLINYTFSYLLGIFKLLSPTPYFIFSFICLFLLILIIFKEKERFKKNLLIISSSLFMLIFLWFLNQFIAKSGSIPWGGDDILGWNSWAMNWYLNNPTLSQSGFYPQMLPITFATSYFFSGTEKIFFFSRSIMPYFFFGIILFGFDNLIQKKTSWSFWGFLSLFWLFIVWREYPRMTQGLADIPSAFLAFSSFMVLLETRNKIENKNLSYGISILLATSSALTKQYGAIYYAGFFLILTIFLIKDYLEIKSEKNIFDFKGLLIFVSISFLLLGSWYLYSFIVHKYISDPLSYFASGPFLDYKYNLLKTHDNSNNFLHTFGMLSGYFKSPFIFILLSILAILGVLVWPFGLVLFLIIIPAYLLWTFFIAYSIRNFSIGLLFFIYQSGIGLSYVFDKLKIKINFNFVDRLTTIENFLSKSKIVYPIFAIAILIIFAFNINYTKEKLTKKQTERMKLYLGNHRDVNKILYDYLKNNSDVIVFTDYPFIRFMPELTYIENSLTNLNDIKNVIKTNSKGIFLILTGFPQTHISEECDKFLKTNKNLKEVARSQNGYIIEWKN